MEIIWSSIVSLFDFCNKYASLFEAICVSVSAIYAVRLYKHTTISSRRLAVTNMLLDREHDEKVKEAEKQVRQLFKSHNSTLKSFVDDDTDERKAILVVLNHYEFMAAGINMGTFDEDVYKRMHYSNVMRTWDMSKEFIYTLRSTHGNTTYFQDFEVMALRWQKSPLQTIR